MKDRLTLLQQANVITKDACQATLMAIDLISRHYNVDENSEQFQMAMTHLARAYDRIKNGDTIAEGLDSEIFDEISSDDEFGRISALNQLILDSLELDNTPDTENSFLLSNLFSLHYACQAKEAIC
ncbi:PRD domain-containing protein [Photobacterium sp. J15]|uniref:PRD domain-containing protein n=1 Tax=Photobacterium sp. J15 TaxID=265901 RepID=UPI0007E497B3|nr:PRD domain-containing protein [Photobacterium sp. J15]